MKRGALLALMGCLSLATCTTTPTPAPGTIQIPPAPEPEPQPSTPPQPEQKPQPAPIEPDANGMIWQKGDFAELPNWNAEDPRPALKAFTASCVRFAATNMPDPGFAIPCEQARQLETEAGSLTAASARAFFTNNFVPYRVELADADQGLLTAYYEPELSVRRAKTGPYTEPILARPGDLVTVQVKRFDPKLPDRKIMGRVVKGELEPYFTRAQIRKDPKHVLAWGKPADVFFLQVQGSGRMRFADGEVARASFAGHNGLKYRSIGRLLIERGDLAAGKASKQGIENWMVQAGPTRAQALMNENPRYVFFKEHALRDPSQGPIGTQGAALTAGASLAVDTHYYPFGLPVWLETRLPTNPKDWKGTPTGVLAITQDSGGAIKGALRADLFMGSGDMAGKLAGIQHHEASWWVLLPNAMAAKREQGA